MSRKYQAYLIIIVAIILLIMSIGDLNFDNLSQGPFSGILGSIAFMVLGIVNIRHLKRKEEDKSSS